MAAPPESTKTSLEQRLTARARAQWPRLTGIDLKFRGTFAYIQAHTTDADTLPLMRLRYNGSASQWGFALYLASKNSYQDQILPSGFTVGTPEEALDCAAGLYLDNT